MSGVRIKYDDIAVGAKNDSNPSSSQKASYVSMTDLKSDEITFPNYALCLPGYALMNGSFVNSPDEISEVGFISSCISGANGLFTSNPVITVAFTNKHSSIGINLVFNDYTHDHCTQVNIKWYDDATLLSDKDFTPNAYTYFCSNKVEYYNKIVITFKKTSAPFRPVFLTKIDYGLNRIFYANELKDLSCYVEVSQISESLSINTLNFSVKSNTDIPFDFQKRQKLQLFFNDNHICDFYMKTGNQTSEDTYYHEAEDCVGMLSNDFMGGIYSDATVQSVVTSIMSGEDIEYTIEDSIKNIALNGYLAIMPKRDALAQIGFAIGAMIDTSYGNGIHIFPVPTTVSGEISSSDIYSGSLSIEHDDVVTGVQLTMHNYTESTESEQLYNGTFTGSLKVTLSDPHHTYTITGGTITDYGTNYAVISSDGSAATTLTACKYSHTTSVIEKTGNTNADKNVKTVTDATLVTSANAQDVLNRVYAYYTNNEYVKANIIIGDNKLGDKATIDTGYRGTRTGIINSMNLKFTNEISAEVTIR